jgi:putative monooxygenase ydhR
MHVQVVNFNLSGMSDAQFRQACDEQFAPAFAQIPDLISKLWLADPASNTYGGVYVWRDRQAMQDYMASDLFKGVASHPNFSNLTAKDFGILEGPTRITNGFQAANV